MVLFQKTVDVMAWDNGFGCDKFMVNLLSLAEMERMSTLEPQFRQLSFQSVYCSYTPPKLRPAASNLVESDRGLNVKKLVIEYNGNTYAVGPFAIEQDIDGGASNFDRKKFEQETEAIKLLVAIAYFFPMNDNIVINKLMVGLSLEAFEKYSKSLQGKYSGFETTFKVLSVGGVMREVAVKIVEATCIPQGQGALYDAILDFGKSCTVLPGIEGKKLLDQRIGMLDIGDKTIDGFVTNGLDTIQQSEFWLTHGISLAYENAHKQIEAPANLIEYHYLNGSMMHFVKDYSHEDLKRLCTTEFSKIADEIFTKIDVIWNKHYPRLYKILLCGGGGIAVRDQLQVRLNERSKVHLELMQNAQFANVSGYYKLGMLTLQKQLQKDRLYAVKK